MKKIIIIALSACFLFGCASQRIADLERHQRYQDREIKILANEILSPSDKWDLIQLIISEEDVEKVTEQVRQSQRWLP